MYRFRNCGGVGHAFVRAVVISAILALAAGCASTGTQESTSQYFRDANITAQIREQILENKTLRGYQINVTTYRGHVMLSGFVNNEDQVRKAVRAARGVAGVISVQNNLVVKGTANRKLPRPGVPAKNQSPEKPGS